jgi:hypothetical protein
LPGLGYTPSKLGKLLNKILTQPRPDLDPNAPNAAVPGLDEAIDKVIRGSNIPGIEAVPNPDFDPNNVNTTPVLPSIDGDIFPIEEGEDEQSEENERDWQRDRLLSPGEIIRLKRGDVDIHELKGSGPVAHRDLYKDRAGNIYVKPKGGRGPGEPTDLNINDF